MPDGGLCHGCACVDADIGCSAPTDRRDGFMKKGKVRIMASALFSKRPRRVDVMKGYEPMYDATLQECLQRPFYLYARGKGRSCRKEIWVFAVFIWVLDTFLTRLFSSGLLAVIPGLFSLAVLVPMYALTVRRLHDLALSGWLALVPYVLEVVGVGLIVGPMVSDALEGLDPSAPSPLGIIILLLAVVIRLVIMCVPSRRRHPVVDNGSLGASQTGTAQYPVDPNGQ